MPLAQTSITSAYANGAQATYAHRCICAPGTNVNNFRLRKRSAGDVCTQIGHGCGYFDTDGHRCTQMHTDIFYLCHIRVNHRSSVVPRGGKAPRANRLYVTRMTHITEELNKNRRKASQGHEIHFVRATEGSPIPNTHNRGFQWPACR